MKINQKLFLIVVLLINNVTFAQKDTLRVLFVGNSYTYYNNLPNIVSNLSKSTSTFIQAEMSAIGGARLKYHYNQQFGLKTKDKIKKGKFNIVVLQEQSMGTLTNKEEFLEYSEKLSDHIKLHGAKPYFFVTWSRKKTPKTQKLITKTYKQAALFNNGIAVLVGEAWRNSKKKNHTLNLYDPDGSHPNTIGSFISACVFVKKLTGEVPEKCKAYKF